MYFLCFLRNAPISFITEIEDGRDQKRNGNGYAPSSSASQEDDGEDEDEIKEETGSQNIEDEEKGGDLIPLGTGTGTGRGGTRTTNGVGKKKPRKQRRIWHDNVDQCMLCYAMKWNCIIMKMILVA